MFFPPNMEIMFDNFLDLTNTYIVMGNKYRKLKTKIDSREPSRENCNSNLQDFKRVAKECDDLKFKRKFRMTREYIRDIKKEISEGKKN